MNRQRTRRRRQWPWCRLALPLVAALLSVATTVSTAMAQETPRAAVAPPAQGTAALWGTIDGIAVEGMVEGPSTEAAPLQVACVFEYSEGDIFDSPPALPAAANGLRHLDEALRGVVTDIRKSGRFTGHPLETLLLVPPSGAIAAQRLLLVGLGDRRAFNPDLMIAVGGVAMREALRLRVTHYGFASDLKDAGVDSPTALVAGNVIKGSIEALRTQRYLRNKGMADDSALTKITMLAGPPFFETAGQGIRDAIATLSVPARP